MITQLKPIYKPLIILLRLHWHVFEIFPRLNSRGYNWENSTALFANLNEIFISKSWDLPQRILVGRVVLFCLFLCHCIGKKRHLQSEFDLQFSQAFICPTISCQISFTNNPKQPRKEESLESKLRYIFIKPNRLAYFVHFKVIWLTGFLRMKKEVNSSIARLISH